MLILEPSALAKVVAHVEADYPREACGLLLGGVQRDLATRRAVDARPARNLNTERAHDRYEMDPADRLAGERLASAAGLAVVGFYHSHPDHDAYFSATDLARSEEHQWGEPWVDPTYAYLVVSVRGGRAVASKAFLVVEGAAQEVPIGGA